MKLNRTGSAGRYGFFVPLLMLVALTGSPLDAQSWTPGGEWEGYNKTLDGQRFSPLTQLNSKNVGTIMEVCRSRVASGGTFESGLVMINGTLFATTATDTIAFDPGNCNVKWRHTYRRHHAAQLPVNRGVAYFNGRVFRGTDDARLIALDAATGQEVWEGIVGDASSGEIVTGAPVAWNGLIVVGTAVGEFGIRGRIMAFDALSGREVWRFNTIPTGKEPGAESWTNRDQATHGGGGTWSTFSIDQSTGELFVPVGNPIPDFAPGERPGSNLFTNSVVVLDAATGQLKWWYQLSPNDSHDYDLGAAPILLMTAKSDSVVAAGSKDGYLYIIDRKSRSLLYRTAVTTVDAAPRPPTPEGILACPGPVGGVEWNGPAFDPHLRTLFVGAVDFCEILKSSPGSKWTPAGDNYGGKISPGLVKGSGWVNAVNPESGRIIWRYHADAPILAGVTPTAGGILMTGDNAGNLLIFRSTTGEVLKTIATGGSISGGVITYEYQDRQYVALTSGNSSRAPFGVSGRPSVVIFSAPVVAATDPSSLGAPDVANGRDVFLARCSVCHGYDGANIAGFDLRSIGTRMSQAKLVAWIKNPLPPMPKVFAEPFEASDEAEIRDVAAYLIEKKQP